MSDAMPAQPCRAIGLYGMRSFLPPASLSRKFRIAALVAALLAALLGCAWLARAWFSLGQTRFIAQLERGFSSTGTVPLSKLHPGDWQLVCESNGYDEPLHLAQFNKTYPNAGAMQDGAWGLLFIGADGQYEAIAGSCANGFHVTFPQRRCLPRAEAYLTYAEAKPGERCKQLIASR